MDLRSKLYELVDMAGHRAARAQRQLAWDYAQANDDAVMNADPLIGQVQAAAAQLDQDPEYAFFCLQELAEQGSVWAAVNLSWCHSVGRGTPVSLKDAETWARSAYEAGCDRALMDYARFLHHRGASDLEAEVYAAGVARDFAPALFCAACLGLLNAKTLKARLVWKPLLERAAAKGSEAAQLEFYKRMLRGSFGLRHVPRGVLLAYRFIRVSLARLDAGDEQGVGEDATVTPDSVTLH